MLTINEIKSKLEQNKDNYHKKYGVKSIGIFGSFSRSDQSGASDIDILVEFDRPIGLAFVDLAEEIEQLLKIKVDLVSKRAIKPRMLKSIEQELIYV